MENVLLKRLVAALATPLPRVRAIIALSGGKVIALPYDSAGANIYVATPAGVGHVRYVGVASELGVHFDGTALNLVTEYPLDACRPVRGGLALAAIVQLLAGNPPVTADLDAPDLAVA